MVQVQQNPNTPPLLKIPGCYYPLRNSLTVSNFTRRTVPTPPLLYVADSAVQAKKPPGTCVYDATFHPPTQTPYI
jgi:hypothetical protein